MKNLAAYNSGFAPWFGGLIVLLVSQVIALPLYGQNREINLRLSSVLGQNDSQIELKGRPVLFPGSASSYSFYNKEFTAGLVYSYAAKPGFYRRIIAQFHPRFQREAREWNLADGDRVTLDLESQSIELTAGFGLGKVVEAKSFRFRIGAEMGLGFIPAYDETQRYEFFDTAGVYVGAQTVVTENLNRYGGYLNLFGSVHYLIGKHLALGIELGYGLRGSYVSGDQRTIYQTYNPLGTPVVRAEEVGNSRSLTISLPSRIDLPYLSLGWRF